MGARLVAEVLSEFTDVGYDAFRVLVRMAHTALDEDTKARPARLYYGGREVLAATLRPDVHDFEEGSKEWRGAEANVRRALRILIEAGAIERVGQAHTGERQVYRLILKRSPDFVSTRRGGKRERRVGLTPQEESHTDSPEESHTDSPVEKEESHTDSQEESHTDSPKEPRKEPLKDQERYQDPCGRRRPLRTGEDPGHGLDHDDDVITRVARLRLISREARRRPA